MATVLLIEDDAAQRAMYRDLLYYNGFDVLQAGDALTGVPLAVEARPDIIVMDVMLPGMSGLEAARQLSRNPATTGIPIICIALTMWPRKPQPIRARVNCSPSRWTHPHS